MADFLDDASHKPGRSFEASREIRVDFVDFCRRFNDVGRRRVFIIMYFDEEGSRRTGGLPLRGALGCKMTPSLTLEASNSRARSR